MIKGLTDTDFDLRRAGKIRAGHEKSDNKLGKNAAHFFLRDAQELIPVLGEDPEEIYFAAVTHDLEKIAVQDLRLYRGGVLTCLGDGESAAYYGKNDVANVKQRPHETRKHARERTCMFTKCPEYISKECKQHVFLNMVIPQYSMNAVFSLESVSINMLIDAVSVLKLVSRNYNGFIGGQIFRLFKHKTRGGPYKKELDTVGLEYIPFEQYEAKFRHAISNENWFALVNLREEAAYLAAKARLERNQRYSEMVASLSLNPVNTDQVFNAAPAVATFSAQGYEPAEPEPEAPAADPALELANDPTVVALFDELAEILGRPHTEQSRIDAARKKGDSIVVWLKQTIETTRKKKAGVAPATTTTIGAAEAVQAAEAITKLVPAPETGVADSASLF